MRAKAKEPWHREVELSRGIRHAVQQATKDLHMTRQKAVILAQRVEDTLQRSHDPAQQMRQLDLAVDSSPAYIAPTVLDNLAKTTQRSGNRRALELAFLDREIRGTKHTAKEARQLTDRGMRAFDKACAAFGLDPARTVVRLRAPEFKDEPGSKTFELWISGPRLPRSADNAAIDVHARVSAAPNGRDTIELRDPATIG